MASKVKEFKGTLSAIFSDTVKDETKELNTISKQPIIESSLPIDCIKPRKNQPRKIFDEASLEKLAKSIKSKGVIQPIIVKSIENGFYEIVVGERRWRASRRAKLSEIPVIVSDYDNADGLAIALIENIQRENLNPLEEAQAIYDLLNEYSMTHAQIAENIGKSRTAVSNLLRLLNLEEKVKSMINAGLLEMGHARALLTLPVEQQAALAQRIVEKNLTVRDAEKLAQRYKQPQEKKINPYTSDVNTWVKSLSHSLSSKVAININEKGEGKVVIHFSAPEEVDWLVKHFEDNNRQ